MSDELKLCELEETESYGACYINLDGELKTTTVHVLECSECGRTCEHVNGTYPRCPYCSAVNVLGENYEPQVIKNAENYKLADDSEPQVIEIGEKHELTDKPDSRERLEADVRDRTECSWVTAPLWKVIDWLNRQAAITSKEWCYSHDALEEELDRVRAERDELKVEISKYEHDCGLLFDEKNKLTADAKRWADAANEQRLVAMEQADKVQELTAERDHFRNHVNFLIDLIADIARKQPYTFDPEAPYETLDTIGDYLDELHGNVASLTAERDELKAKLETYGKVSDQGEREELSPAESGDTRENLKADIYSYLSEAETKPADVPLFTHIIGWLDRQAAITRRECHDSEGWRIGLTREAVHDGAPVEIFGVKYVPHAVVDNLTAEVEAQRKRANDAERGVLNGGWYVSRDRHEDDIAKLKEECDKLLAELEAYRDFEKGEFAIPLDEAMKFTTDPPGYIKKHIAELQAERDEWKAKAAEEFAKADGHWRIAKNLVKERDKLRDEMKHKQLVIDVQRESFRKIEADCKRLANENECFRKHGTPF